MMGLAWSFLNPLLMLAVYTFVFSVVFMARWGEPQAKACKGDFAILLFIGMIIHGLFAECANKAPSLILKQCHVREKVVFPLEILPLVTVCTALFHAAIGLAVLLVAQLVITHQLPWTVVFFPLILLSLVLTTLGVTWFLASIGVYLRDVAQSVGIFTLRSFFSYLRLSSDLRVA